MKTVFFVTAMLFSSLSFEGQRVFDCQATKLSKNPAINEDFNISIATPTSVLELAEMIWNKINPNKPFSYVSDDPFE